MYSLVIVESPAKCKKIESYLGNGFKCIASFGHIYKLTNVDADNNYKPEFKTMPEKGKYIKNLRNEIKKCKEVILATDDDREGEAIAWHICRLAKLPINSTKRIIFHEITKPAIQKAIKSPTIINMKKVNAQLGRQVLDRMVGFTISPTLWKQFFHSGNKKTSLSAGRCQTPALRLVYENQKEIDQSPGNKVWETTGIFTKKNLLFKLNYNYTIQDEIEDFMEESANFDHVLLKPKDPTNSLRKPPLPFSTSTLQQKASNELHYSPKRTMQLAQKLYENGYITYMRTDNKKYSKQFVKEVVPFIKKKWNINNEYINTNLNKITIGEGEKKDKNAQEAHEAIRPTKLNVENINIGEQENRLYKLIWTNTIESCMADAILNVIKAIITAPMNHLYEYKADMIKFPGWLIVNGYDKISEFYNFIKKINKNHNISYKKIYAKQNLKNLKTHFTEARLVQMLEKKGIGRPSTFSSLISKIQERGYVKKQNIEGKKISCVDYQLQNDELDEIDIKRTFGNEKNKLLIQPLGKMVIEFLLKQFDPLFVYEYTENMESKLDDISKGISKWQDLCRDCDATMKTLTNDIKQKKSYIEIDENHVYMIGKYGPVIKKEKDGVTKFINVKDNLDLEKLKNGEYNIEDIKVEKLSCGKKLGLFNDNDVLLKEGKFGLYITCNGKNYSLKGINKKADEITFEDVADILSGKKSSNPNVIRILNENLSIRKGKYGPYIFFKTKTMGKPKFFSMQQLFKMSKTDKVPDNNWRYKSEKYLINLFNQNCN
jgi:DNA topoisomerase-1